MTQRRASSRQRTITSGVAPELLPRETGDRSRRSLSSPETGRPLRSAHGARRGARGALKSRKRPTSRGEPTMNAVLAFVASFLMLFITLLIVAAALYGLLLAGLDLCAALARMEPQAHRDGLERRRGGASTSGAQTPAGETSDLS